MFQRPFSFEGRIRRLEYGITFIIYIAVYLLVIMITTGNEDSPAAIAGLIFIPLVWFVWAQGAKRCHDVGKSGWWQLIPFYFLVLIFQDGDLGRNEYGSNPKFPEQEDILESETLDGHLKN